MNKFVRHQVFGKNENPTIYYFIGYGSKIAQFQIHIKLLALAGFRIFAFEYDRRILDDGKPQLLIKAIKEALELASKDKTNRKIAGAYGISLGSLFTLNLIKVPEINKAVLNTGGVRLSKAIWESPYFKNEKTKFQKSGYSRETLDKIWDAYDISTDGSKLINKKLLIMDSKDDPVILFEDVNKHTSAWKEQGVDVELLLSRKLNHGQEIFRNLFRIRRTIKFFRT